MYYDSHTHLNSNELYPQRKDYLQHFIDGGGKGLVNIGVDAERNQRAIDIAIQAEQQFPDTIVKATIGFHPFLVCSEKIGITSTSSGVKGNETKDPENKKLDSSASRQVEDRSPQNDEIITIQAALQSLKTLLQQHPKHIVAIGECGIDTHYDGDPHINFQKELFAQQCDLAEELGLPIVIHSRSDFASTFDVIKKYKQQKIYFHCRGYGPDEIDILQAHFPHLRIGFCGNITYPKAQAIRDSLLRVHPENIVFETDAPYLAPQGMRGQQNEPANVAQIYDFVGELLDKNTIEFQGQIEKNFRKLYNT